MEKEWEPKFKIGEKVLWEGVEYIVDAILPPDKYYRDYALYSISPTSLDWDNWRLKCDVQEEELTPALSNKMLFTDEGRNNNKSSEV